MATCVRSRRWCINRGHGERTADPLRRDRLIAIALELFTRYGVRRTSIDDIAAAAKIAEGSVYLSGRSTK